METKKCSRCGKEFPKTTEFFYRRDGKKYFSSWCKKCIKEEQIENPERHRKNLKKYGSSPKGIYHSLKNNKRLLIEDISLEEFVSWYNSQERICVYCGLKEEDLHKVDDIHNNKSNRLSIDRKDNDKGYVLNNIVLSCYKCNTIKNNLFSFEEMKEISQKYIKPKWERKLGRKND